MAGKHRFLENLGFRAKTYRPKVRATPRGADGKRYLPKHGAPVGFASTFHTGGFRRGR